jgi:signal transduction histidine kinase
VFNDTLGRLESAFDDMRRFTADVSHELRTPLTAMRSVGEVALRDRRDPHAYRAVISSMLEEVDRLGSLVDRLLSISRATLGPSTLSRETIDLRNLAEDVASQLSVLAEEKQQSMTMEPQGSPRGVGDRVVVRQSVMNLVDNAIKYTPNGGHIRIRVWASPGAAMLEVSDNGPGIAADTQRRIFDRFYRAHPSGEVGGFGLGLAIAKRAMEASGGELCLEPTEGVGSTFRITLPRANGAVPS